MNISKRFRISALVLSIIIGLSSINVSHGTSMASDPLIRTRGLVFNTGISSDQIRMVKDFFRARNESGVAWGYDYDSKTKELVKKYQKIRGLKADGIAGQSTIDRMNREIKDRDFKIGLRVPYTDIKGDMIIINKSSNTLYFLRDGSVLNSYPVATGKTPALTPNGKHRIVVKNKNPGWGGAGRHEPIPGGAPNNPLGKRWIGISYGGGGQYGVHGNSNPNSIGTYASLGCIRMFNEDVEKLYEKVKINTPTWIGEEGVLQKYGVKFKSNYVEKPVVVKEKNEESKAVIRINGQELNLDTPVINKDGTTYYPFREIIEAVNGQVFWDEESQCVRGVLDGNVVEFQLNSNRYRVNGIYETLPVGQKAFASKNRSYAPIRNTMEALGFHVGWDQTTRTIIVNNR